MRNQGPGARGQGPDIDAQRRGLLAKVHIAIHDLGISEPDYRYILERNFHTDSARHLSVFQLQFLVNYFEEKGWRPKKVANKPSQAAALRARILEIAGGLENGKRRLSGLCWKLCGTERVEWCRETGKLKRLLMALETIKKQEAA
jgi:hypothetical protein